MFDSNAIKHLQANLSMYFITEDNGLEARLARLEGELEAMRAEIEALKAAEKPVARDRREYMREYMRRKRATAVCGGGMPDQ